MNRKTKLVCTLGPASSSADQIRGLVDAGMDVARLNFSHGSHEEHGARIEAIRRIEKETGRAVAILQDLGGPKIRIGEIAGVSVDLQPDKEFVLTSREVPGDEREVSISYKSLPQEVKPGDPILLADGLVELQVVKTTETDIVCRVLTGGTLTSRKGINLPSGTLSVPALTAKDREDLEFGIVRGVDLVALSFVRKPEDVSEVKQIIESRGGRIPVIAKIEKHEALECIAEILEVSDGCMVARGDLGVEIPLEKVPFVQKSLINRARVLGKPVITATQMLTSMVDSYRPTRAEVADVTNAVLDGTDAVMLSEETAVGKHPKRVVEIMDRIAREAEKALLPRELMARSDGTADVPDAISSAVCYLADTLQVAALVVPTESGTTARLVARHRPRQPVLAFSPREETIHALKLSWGTVATLLPPSPDLDQIIIQSLGSAKDRGLVKSGDRVIITAGLPIRTQGTTNLIRVEVVP